MGIEQRSDVYSLEVNLSNIAQPLVGSTQFAFQGAAKRGPVDDYYEFSDPDRFLDVFGRPDAAIGMAHYDVLQAFNEGAGSIIFRRIVSGDATFGGLLVQNKTVSSVRTLTVLNTSTATNLAGLSSALTALGTAATVDDNVLYYYPVGPGSESSNIAIEHVSPNLASPTANAGQAAPPAGSTHKPNFTAASVYNYYVTAFNTYGETTPSTVSTVTYSGTTDVIVVNVPANTSVGALGFRVYRTTGSSAPTSGAVLIGTMAPTDLQFVDFNDGSYSVTVPPASSTIPTQEQFVVNIYDNRVSQTLPQESFECSLKSRTSSAGKQTLIEAVINNESSLVRVQNNTPVMSIVPVMRSLVKTPLLAGSSGSAITSSDVVVGIQVLVDKEKYPIAGVSDSGFATLVVQQGIASLIKRRGRGIALLNAPQHLQKSQDAINYFRVTLGTSGDRLVATTPDHFINDPYNNQQLYTPSSGVMAGLLSFTDKIRNPGWSPAGYQRGITTSTIKLRHSYTDQEKNQLAAAQVNYFSTERLYGTVLRECYTLTPDFSAISFIPVRRILDVAEETAEKLLKFYLQEPNTDIAGLQIVTRLKDLYQLMKGANMIAEYEVVDKTTAVQRSQGNKYIYSMLTPLIPTIRIAHTTAITQQGVSFNTVIQALGA